MSEQPQETLTFVQAMREPETVLVLISELNQARVCLTLELIRTFRGMGAPKQDLDLIKGEIDKIRTTGNYPMVVLLPDSLLDVRPVSQETLKALDVQHDLEMN
jgi:hypothetical protein